MGILTNYKSLSDEELMTRFQSGRDERAFNCIYRRYSNRLLYFMYRMLSHNEPLAQDKLHDVFTRLIENPRSFNVSRNFKTWIFTVSANECKKHYRNEKTLAIDEQPETQDFGHPDILDKIDHTDFTRELNRQLDRLSFSHRSVFVMRYQEHLSIKEISVIMDCSEGTVKSRSHYCLKKLSESLSVYNPTQS
ncbi:MAG: RNA polymerase sigma factor [Salibacteraceae bacterium]